MRGNSINTITFHWVKAHSSLLGNVRAIHLTEIVGRYKYKIAYRTVFMTNGKATNDKFLEYNKLMLNNCCKVFVQISGTEHP